MRALPVLGLLVVTAVSGCRPSTETSTSAADTVNVRLGQSIAGKEPIASYPNATVHSDAMREHAAVGIVLGTVEHALLCGSVPAQPEPVAAWENCLVFIKKDSASAYRTRLTALADSSDLRVMVL